jgi:hypothetical protein
VTPTDPRFAPLIARQLPEASQTLNDIIRVLTRADVRQPSTNSVVIDHRLRNRRLGVRVPPPARPVSLSDKAKRWKWSHAPQLLGRAYFRTRKRSIVTGPDCVLLNGSRSILPRPEVEKRTPSPSNTGSTYTRTSSTSPRCRH